MGVNLIEGNVAIGVESDNGIQVTAGAIVRNNIVIGWGPSKFKVVSWR
jgi:tetrahydrodipicolinate N-succinyltransferase